MMTFALLAVMISCTVIANLLMKLGAADQPSAIFLDFLSWRSFIGLGVFGCAALLYAAILKTLPLNVSQAYMSTQFVAVIVAAAWVLNEPVSPARWLGIAFIAVGIAIVASTT